MGISREMVSSSEEQWHVTAEDAVPLPRHAVEERTLFVAHEVREVVALFEPEINIVWLRRSLPSNVSLAAHARSLVVGMDVKIALSTGTDGRNALSTQLGDAEHAALLEDVSFWIEVLTDLTGASTVGLRLTRLTTAMCPGFHVDRVGVRVVVTYVGPGTEYLSNDDVVRQALPGASRDRTEPRPSVVRAGGRVRQAQAGDVLFLKGESWPDNGGNGAVHRSPIPLPDCPRLLMTLDVLT